MTEGKNIQSWVQKAVADVAAFGGFSLRRVDTKAERMAIGALLANANLTEDDREYIEGFMLDRSAKSEKIDGERPRRNKERSVEIPAGPMYAQSFDELKEIADTREKLKLFFDDKGRVVRNELKGKDGETFVLNNIHYINDEESEITTEQRMPGGVTTTSKLRYNNKAGKVVQIIDMVMKNGDKVIQEQHTMDDGVVVKRQYKELSEVYQYAFHFPKISDLDFDYEKVTVFEQTYKDGNVTGRYIDKEGNVLATIQGTYTQNQFGNLVPQYPSDEQDVLPEYEIAPRVKSVEHKYHAVEKSDKVQTFDTKEERDMWIEQQKKAVKSTDKDYDNKAFDKDVKKKEE